MAEIHLGCSENEEDDKARGEARGMGLEGLQSACGSALSSHICRSASERHELAWRDHSRGHQRGLISSSFTSLTFCATFIHYY